MPAHDHGYAFIEAASTNGSAYATYLYLAPALPDLPPGYITTVGGVGTFLPYHRPAKSVPLLGWGLDVENDGSIVTASAFLNSIVRIDRSGFLRPVAGTGSFNPDLSVGDGGDARKAQLAFPRRPEIDGAGNIYIATEDHRVRRIDAATGVITTIAGTGMRGFAGDGGPATSALLNAPNVARSCSRRDSLHPRQPKLARAKSLAVGCDYDDRRHRRTRILRRQRTGKGSADRRR